MTSERRLFTQRREYPGRLHGTLMWHYMVLMVLMVFMVGLGRFEAFLYSPFMCVCLYRDEVRS
jgi:hypothetical protein